MKRAHSEMHMAPESADALACAVCLATFADPATLPCNHTFCRECILNLEGRGQLQSTPALAECACPLCRRGVSVPGEVRVNPIICCMLAQLTPSAVAEISIPTSEIVRGAEIGRGAVGTVYAGTWHGQPVALKVIRAATLGAAEEREAATRRLRREVAILSMLRHPGVVQFYGVVREAGGGVTLVTEKAEKSLQELLAEQRLTLAECLDLGEQLMGALAHLHSHNIVHRDVKPGNILVFRGEGGRPQYKLADFGFSLAAAASTMMGIGTPAYAAPEVLRSDGRGRPDFAGDVYAAGVALNEALAGRAPYSGVRIRIWQLVQRVVNGLRPQLATQGVPAAVQALVQRMWATDATARPSAEEARVALAAARSQLPPSTPSIMDAVRWASPGETIRIAPGRYREAVVLEKEVHIVGPREAILEWDKGAALHCKGPAAPSVRGITIRNTAPKNCAVWITEGSRAVLEECDVSSSNSGGIKVKDEGTAPLLRSNAVHGCGREGIFFHASAKGTAEGNDVFGNAWAGISIQTGADPVVRGNRIHDCSGGGIIVHSGRGTMEENDVFGNTAAGIHIQMDADPVVRGNRIRDQKWGILVGLNARATITNNTFERIAVGGQAIEVDPSCTGCRVEGNTIR